MFAKGEPMAKQETVWDGMSLTKRTDWLYGKLFEFREAETDSLNALAERISALEQPHSSYLYNLEAAANHLLQALREEGFDGDRKRVIGCARILKDVVERNR